MKIAFVSNFLSHHQIPFSDAISNMQVNVIVQQDSRGVFNMVKQEVVQEQRRTGKPVWT